MKEHKKMKRKHKQMKDNEWDPGSHAWILWVRLNRCVELTLAADRPAQSGHSSGHLKSSTEDCTTQTQVLLQKISVEDLARAETLRMTSSLKADPWGLGIMFL